MNRVARLLVVVVALAGATMTGGARAVAADTATTTAVIVIDTGSSAGAITVDVGSGMSGLAALQRVANVTTLSFAGNGGAVCAIDGVGNDATQSACLVGPNSQYWAYFHSSGGAGAWTYSPVGAGSFTVHGGDVEGWRYGTGQKPGASAVFCDYVTCAPPPTTAPPSGGAAGTGAAPAGGSAGGTNPGSGGAATGGTGGGTTGAAPTAGSGGDVNAAAADSQPATSTTDPAADRADTSGSQPNGNGVRVEAAGAGTGGGPDSGSPVGVAIAAGILAIAAASAIWLRRRSRVPG
jgi:hypothetical protein